MRLHISSASIRHPLLPLLLTALLCILGARSFVGLAEMRYPAVDVPEISVTISLAGTAPTELETQVTRKVENGLAAIAGVRHLSSTVSDGVSVTALEFRLDQDPQRARSAVTDAVAKIRGDLPSAIDEPAIQLKTSTDKATVTYAVDAPALTTEQLSWFIDDTLLGAIQGISGVGTAVRVGGVARQINVDLDPDRMMALGVTASEINQQLVKTNIDAGGGKALIGGHEQVMRTLASASSVESLGATRIPLSGGRTVRLADVASIADHWQDPTSFASADGAPIVGFAVYRLNGASDVSVGQHVDAKIAALMNAHPGITIRPVDNTIDVTIGNYEAAMRSLWEGAVLSVHVVMLFLRDWRATLIAGLALPLSILPTFLAMTLLGFSLNIVTMLAITLVTGILVDDAIVEVENIVRHLHMGKTPFRAAIDAADEIGPTVVAISATVIFIFAPVSFMPDVAGQYFKQFGVTIACAVLFSLLVARLVTPVLAAYFMRPTGRPAQPGRRREGLAMQAYVGLLRTTLAPGMRWVTLAVAIGLLVIAVVSMSTLPRDFIPKSDDSRLVASIELPAGSTLDATRTTTEGIGRRLKAVPEIVGLYVKGGASSGSAEPRRAELVMRLSPRAQRQRSQADLQTIVAKTLSEVPDIRYTFDHQATVALVGPDEISVETGAARLTAAMRTDPLFVAPMALTSFARPEIRLHPKEDRPSTLGIASSAIAETVRIATAGETASRLAQFTTEGRQVPIMVRLEQSVRTALERIAMLQVPSASGPLPLSSLVDLVPGEGPVNIERYDRERLVTIGFDPAKGHTPGEGTDRVATLLSDTAMPPGVHLQDSGDAELESEMFADFGHAMGVGILLVFVVLILLSGNVFQPLTIMTTLPLSAIGVVAALLVTHSAFSLPVVIGLLMLMGIVCKNAIMLIDTATLGVKAGLTRRDALIEAGRKRSRPVIMTTVAMVAGMAPAAYGVGVGGEFRMPMAIAVIGGLMASTILSLVVVPPLYTIMDDLSHAFSQIFRSTFRPNAPECVSRQVG